MQEVQYEANFSSSMSVLFIQMAIVEHKLSLKIFNLQVGRHFFWND